MRVLDEARQAVQVDQRLGQRQHKLAANFDLSRGNVQTLASKSTSAHFICATSAEPSAGQKQHRHQLLDRVGLLVAISGTVNTHWRGSSFAGGRRCSNGLRSTMPRSAAQAAKSLQNLMDAIRHEWLATGDDT